MRDTVKKIVLKLFPELSAGLHLDRFARVLAVNDAPTKGDMSERSRPRYAVDLEILTPDGERDDKLPVYEAVQLPVTVGCGQEAGLFGFPEPGTIVTIGFAYGRADHPLIRQIYPQGMTLPEVAPGQLRWQQSSAVFQDVDKGGNWTRKTDMAITDESLINITKAVEKIDAFSREHRQIRENSIEEVGGFKIIEALGALRLRSGGSANLTAVDNINLTTGRDLNKIVAQDRNEVTGRDLKTEIKRHVEELIGGNLTETVLGNRTEDVEGDRTESTGNNLTSDISGELTVNTGGKSTETVAGNKTIEAPFINLQASTIRMGQGGEGGASLIPIIIAFMEEVRHALLDLSTHTHPAIGAKCNMESELSEHSVEVGELKSKLGTING